MLDYRDNKSIWFEKMLDQGIMAASYKAFWLKGLIEEIVHNNRDEIPFEAIVNRMIVNAWFPIVKYRLSFGYSDKLGRVIDYIHDIYGLDFKIDKTNLLKELEYSEVLIGDKNLSKLKRNFFNLVPYRLISPFFKDDLKGFPDNKRNRIIEKLSAVDPTCIYRVSSKDKCIYIRNEWMEYIKNNQSVIQGWLQHKLVMYIESKNPNVPNVMFKLDAPMNRNLKVATTYWKQFLAINNSNDIYTGELLAEENFRKRGVLSIDHFIPWSFVMHNEPWNLTPTFKNVNSSKNDGLPKLDRYLDEFLNIQYRSIQYMKEGTTNQKYMESYYNISRGKLLEDMLKKGIELDEKAFYETLKDTLIPLYGIARNQGFEIWEM